MGAATSLVDSVGEYVDTHQDGIIALCLTCATAVTFSGRTLLRPTVFLSGFLPTFGFFSSIGYSLLPEPQRILDDNRIRVFPSLIVIVALLLGVLAGMIMLKVLFALATFLITAMSGAVLVFLVHVLLLQTLTSSGQVILATFAVVAAMITGVVSLVYPRTMIIIGTAFDGGACTVYSLSHFLGHQPRVFGSQTSVEAPLWALGYSLATFVLAAYGIYVQLLVAATETARNTKKVDVQSNLDETEPLLPTYGSVDGDYGKSNALGAPPLSSYDDEEAGHS